MTVVELRERVAELVSEATGGDVAVADLLAGGSLVALGLDSLGLLRLVDAVELEYGVEVDLQTPGRGLDTLDDLVALLVAARGGGPVVPVGGVPAG
ncbi:acyl carrier protein [Micromonospora sp. WMMD882]|uniref:acyl carrier protein n=1 Tax=Micromonospora sp. WMMD882 TaxID=3015151 RepID=UPI00248CDE35|nr:acyl carrier protein [Micromonospora sp. WMMD882]WBB80557.1 acyl carrier protein [Micromonospora sp. WMMD882]